MCPDVTPLSTLIRDRRWWLAIAAGPVFWLVYWAWTPISAATGSGVQPGQWLMLVLVYPVLEEAVFRGLLQGMLFQPRLGPWKWHGITGANLLASALFVLAHLPHQSPGWALATFGPSLVFGYFRDRHDRLASPVVLHVWYNLGFFSLFG